jgi:dolichol-phosphate mannosyltransferase
VYEGLSIAGLVPVLDEEHKIGSVLARIPGDVVDETIVVDDGSTDTSAARVLSAGATLLSMGRTFGVGAALRAGFTYAAERGHDVVVVMAGNNKDAPEEIPRLLQPIASGAADFVQGSRWLEPQRDFGEMPAYRRLATRMHPAVLSYVAGQRITDSTNGFRALRVEMLRDEQLDLRRSSLDGYDLEPHLLLRAIALGYGVCEVPVTKRYPPKSLGQTKMRPLLDWWVILRPIVRAGMRGRGSPPRSRDSG